MAVAKLCRTTLACAILAFSGYLSATPGETIVGNPVSGVLGTRIDTAQLMADQAAYDQANAGKPRPLRVNPFHRVAPNQQPNPDALPGPGSTRTGIGGVSPLIAQTVSISFLGAQLSDSNVVPPDSMGAVGPTQFLVTVNGRFRSFSKTSGSPDGILDVSDFIFFGSVETPLGGLITSNFTSDPRVRYDRMTDRWYVTQIDVPNNANGTNRVMLAVSDGGVITPNTIWTYFWFPGDVTNFADFPTLGVDANALYMGTNLFNSIGNFVNTNAYVIRKSSILGSGPIVVTTFANLIDGSSNGPYAPMGADNDASSPTNGYIVGTDAHLFGRLALRLVGNAGGIPTLSGNVFINTATTSQPNDVPANGTTVPLNANDWRLMNVEVRNGSMWTAHTILVDMTGAATNDAVKGRDGIRWYQIGSLDTVPSVTQSGTVFDPANVPNAQTGAVNWYWFGSINVTGQNHAAIGFSAAGAPNFANGAYAGRLSGDPLGTTQAVTFLTSANTTYNITPARWGDYSYISLDPDDNMTLWSIQEFCNGTDSWGVQVTKLLAPPPAAPVSAVPNTLAGNQTGTVVTINGTSSGGSGFFDPGPGFASHLQVNIPGVVVTSVSYVSPTQLQATLNTVGATPGLKTITVINPDGQSASGAGLLTITGNAAPIITSANTVTCIVGGACNFTVTANGAPAVTIGESGALPTGVNFGAGVFSGSAGAGTQGTYNLTITATNGVLPNASQSFTLIVSANCGGFTDIPGGAIYCNQVQWLNNRGITLGCTPTQYCPNDTVTRAQMALFMNRLGNAMEPLVGELQGNSGALSLDSNPIVCPTAAIAAANYPRITTINWTFSGQATEAVQFDGRLVASVNGGATWSVLDSQFMRGSSDATAAWVPLGGNNAYPLAAGASVQFGLRLDRVSGPGNFNATTCHMQTLTFSQTGSASPFVSAPVTH